MMTDTIFRIILPALIVGFMMHRGYYTRKIQHSAESVLEQPKPGKISQMANLISLSALAATFVYVFIPDWLSWSTFSLPTWMRWLGLGLALGGFGLLQWAQNSLGQSWSDDPQFVKGQMLVKSGPYQWVRHPIYTAFLFIFGSVILISANWLVGGLWVGAMGLEIHSRIRSEEAMLAHQFGESYHAYMQKTGKLLPRLQR